jgi:PAS domain S-box-containing protein
MSTISKEPAALDQPHGSLSRGQLGRAFDWLDGVTDAVVTTDRELRITYLNNAAKRMMDKGDQVLGKSLIELFPDLPDLSLFALMKQALEQPGPFRTEFLYPPYGIWIDIRISQNENGLIFFGTEITARKRTEARLALLANISDIIASWNDDDSIFTRIPNAAIGAFADWSDLFILRPDRTFDRYPAEYDDPERQRWAEGFKRFPPSPSAELGPARALVTMKSELIPHLPDDYFPRIARSPEHLAFLRTVGFDSVIFVPLIGRGESLGVISFARTSAATPFDEEDLATAEEFGRRVALFLETTTLFRQAQEEIRERRKTEERLQRVSRILAGVVSASADIIWASDENGNMIDSSQLDGVEASHWTEYTGQAETDTHGDGWLDAVHPDDRESAKTTWARILAERVPATNEFRVLRKDGVYRDVEDRVVPIVDEQGTLSFWVATTVDVTEQRELEEAQRETEQRFRGTFEQAAVGVAIVSPEGRWIRVNDRLCAILGYSREEMLAKTFQEITHPDDLDRDLAENRRLLNGEISTFTIDKRYLRKDGEPVWTRLTAALSRKPDGSPDYFVSIIQDIQETHLAEQERDRLREQEQGTIALLDTLLSGSPNGFAFFDPSLRIVRANRAFSSISGLSLEKHIGRTFRDLVPEIAASQEQVLQQVMATGVPVIDRELNTSERRNWIVSYYPVHAIDGQILGVGAAAVEITDRKRIEERLAQSEERLRIALKSAPIMMYQQDADLVYRWAYNFEAVQGQSMYGKTDHDLMAKEEADYLVAVKRRVMSTGIVERTKVRVRGAGRTIHLDLTIEPLISANGKIDGVTGSAVDITAAVVREDRIKRLQSLTAELASAADEHSVAEAIAEYGAEAVDAAAAFVTTTDPDTGTLIIRAASGFAEVIGREMLGMAMPTPSAMAEAVERKAPIFIEGWEERVQRYPDAIRFRLQGEGAIAALPLLIEDRPIGALGFLYDADRSFGREERDYCGALADLCAQALERARLFDAERRAKASSEAAQRRLAILSEISGELTAKLGTEDRVTKIAHLVVPDIADWCLITKLEPGQRVAEVVECVGRTPEVENAMIEHCKRFPLSLDDGFGAGWVLRTGRTLFTPDAQRTQAESPDLDEKYGPLNTTSYLAVPLPVRGEVRGTISLGMTISRRIFTESDVALAEEIGRRAAISMDNAALFAHTQIQIQERERASARTAKLQDVTAALSKAVTVDETINAVLEHAYPAAGADFGLVILSASDQQSRINAGLKLTGSEEHFKRLGNPATIRGPRWIESPDDWERKSVYDLRSYRDRGVASLACLPFMISPAVMGEIVFGFSVPRTFGEEDRAYLIAMSQLIGQALDRSRAYDRERDALASASAAEARYRGLFEGSADPVLVLDFQERIQDANPAALSLLGYDRHEIRELATSDLVVGGESLISSLSTGRTADATWNGEFELRRKDGSVVPVEARAAMVHMVTGSAVTITARDISQRRLIEQTQQEFFASISHDLKNPLAALRGQVQLLQRRSRRKGVLDQEDLQPGLETIQSVGDRMSGMIDELIDVARLRGGYELHLRRNPTDLVEIVTRRVNEHQQSTTRHTITVTAEQSSITGWWDASRLVRVIDNLLVNAIKYSEGGDILLNLRTETDSTGAVAVFTIRDFGVGIPASDLPHVFERFRRGSNVLDRFAGTGLGLSGVRQIVEQHGGQIEIQSEEGAGTEVTFRLPITDAPDDLESAFPER